jgi:hypothetical protein
MSTHTHIIKRWNDYLLAEGLDEKCNRYFDPDTGHFTSKEKAAQKGGTHSISVAASERCGDKEAKPGKMKVTSTGKLKPKFTLAQCGRVDARSGGKKPKGKRCRDYPKGRYGDENTKKVSESQRETLAKRQQQPEERKERYFAGNKELSRLARGIYEVDGEMLIRPDEMDAEELSEMSLLLDEQQQPCPQHCIQQVLNLFARIKQAEKGEG